MGTVYIFLDESGNFDFSPTGTKYLVLGCVVYRRSCPLYAEMMDLRYDLMEEGYDIERFHATSDRQEIRDRVFDVIGRHLGDIAIHSLIVEKAKTAPSLHEMPRFYPEMLGFLLRYVFERLKDYDEIIVITDSIPVKKQRKAVEKAVKTTLSNVLPSDVSYRIYHHDSRSNMGIQVADYCTWAIQRRWKDGDERSYNLIQAAVKSELDMSKTGTTRFY